MKVCVPTLSAFSHTVLQVVFVLNQRPVLSVNSHIAPLSLPTCSRLLGLLRLHRCITAISLYYHMHGTIGCLIWMSLETRTLYL